MPPVAGSRLGAISQDVRAALQVIGGLIDAALNTVRKAAEAVRVSKMLVFFPLDAATRAVQVARAP